MNNYNNIDWEDLRYVLAVMKQGSISGAAREIGVNHATVIRRVEKVEERIGFQIFDRTARGTKPSLRAIGLLDALNTMEKGAKRFSRITKDEPEEISGPLKITSTDFMVAKVLSKHAKNMRAAFPNAQISLIATYNRMNLAALDADIGVRLAMSLPSELVGVRVGSISLGVYGLPEYFEKNVSTEYHEHSWIGVTDVLYKSPTFEWQSRLAPESIVTKTDSLMTNASLVREGVGIAMLPKLLADGLIRAPMFDDEISADVWVCAGKDFIEVERIQAAKNWLTKALSFEPSITKEISG